MPTYTERVQTVLSPEQYQRLSRLAEKTDTPMSVLIRRAVQATYFERMDRQLRQQALNQILAMQAPVSDWAEMEDEIEKGALSE